MWPYPYNSPLKSTEKPSCVTYRFHCVYWCEIDTDFTRIAVNEICAENIKYFHNKLGVLGLESLQHAYNPLRIFNDVSERHVLNPHSQTLYCNLQDFWVDSTSMHCGKPPLNHVQTWHIFCRFYCTDSDSNPVTNADPLTQGTIMVWTRLYLVTSSLYLFLRPVFWANVHFSVMITFAEQKTPLE